MLLAKSPTAATKRLRSRASLASHCNTVSLVTSTNGGYITAETLTDGTAMDVWRAMVRAQDGDPDATDEELWEALSQVALAERVRALPEGLGTPVGEDGAGLSAGERARKWR